MPVCTAHKTGDDATPVQAADPKKSISVTSWLTHGTLGELVAKQQTQPASGLWQHTILRIKTGLPHERTQVTVV
eukprot:3727752-Amphidinium_carterae.2